MWMSTVCHELGLSGLRQQQLTQRRTRASCADHFKPVVSVTPPSSPPIFGTLPKRAHLPHPVRVVLPRSVDEPGWPPVSQAVAGPRSSQPRDALVRPTELTPVDWISVSAPLVAFLCRSRHFRIRSCRGNAAPLRQSASGARTTTLVLIGWSRPSFVRIRGGLVGVRKQRPVGGDPARVPV